MDQRHSKDNVLVPYKQLEHIVPLPIITIYYDICVASNTCTTLLNRVSILAPRNAGKWDQHDTQPLLSIVCMARIEKN